MLLRFPGLLLAVGAAVAILAVTGASSPLFLSSAGNAALARGLAAECAWRTGLKSASSTWMSRGNSLAGSEPMETIPEVTDRVRGAAEQIAHTGSPEWQVMSDTMSASTRSAALPQPVKLYTRPGVLDHVEKIGPGSGNGAWIPDRLAHALGIGAGETFRVTSFQGRLKVMVAGVYRDLASLPRARFWCGQGQNIYPIGDALPPALVLFDPPGLEPLNRRGNGFPVTATWLIPVDPQGLTLPEARSLAAAFEVVKSSVQVGGFDSNATSALPGVVDRAQATVDSLRASVDTIALAGSLVAMLVVAAAGVFWVHRRRSEAVVLATKGFGPPSTVLKVLLETAPVAVLGGSIGWAAGIWLVRMFGPSGPLDPGAPGRAMIRAAWVSAAGVAVVALVAAVAARRDVEPTRRWRRTVGPAPWEVAVLMLAAAALYEVLTRGPVRTSQAGEPKVDILVLLFPVLFVLGGAGLTARAVRRALPLLRTAGSRWPPSLYLASRRLASAPRIAVGLLTVTALSVGILAYGSVLSASVRATAEAKAKVFTGSDLAVTLAKDTPAPATLASRATTVSINDSARVLPQQELVELLGVDRSSFAAAAFWDSSFADRPLGELIDALGDGPGPLRVVATEDLGAADGTFQVHRTAPGVATGLLEIPFTVVARVRAFPGMPSGLPLLVADRSAVAHLQVPGYQVMWVRGNPDESLRVLRTAGAPILFASTAQEALETPSLLSLAWAFGFLQALGVVIGLIVACGMLLYVEAHQRTRAIAFALARRMGLTPRAHRLSVGAELAVMLATGSVAGMLLAWGAARLVYGRLDLLPALPPHALFRTPLGLLGLALAAAVATSALAAWGVQRATERTHVAEAIRVAG